MGSSGMRVLHLMKHCESANGHVNVAVDIACTHAGQGHAIAVASAGGALVPLLAANGVGHLAWGHGVTPVEATRALAALVRLCRAFRPDVIHAHMMASAALGFVASRLCGLPLVTTVHNSFDRHSGLMRLGDAVVAVSEAERRLLVTRGFPAHKLLTIHNGPVGSPRDALCSVAQLPRAAGPSIVTVSGLHARKGCRDVIDAFAAVAARHPAWRLDVVGDGPDRSALEARTRSLGLAGRIVFQGNVVHAKPWLERASIFVLASHAEPFGLVVAEARAAGCAVVATAVGGIPEALHGGQAGQLVPPGSPDAIAARLSMLMADPVQLACWRQRARIGIEAFATNRMADAYGGLYGQLTPGGRSRAGWLWMAPSRLRV